MIAAADFLRRQLKTGDYAVDPLRQGRNMENMLRKVARNHAGLREEATRLAELVAAARVASEAELATLRDRARGVIGRAGGPGATGSPRKLEDAMRRIARGGGPQAAEAQALADQMRGVRLRLNEIASGVQADYKPPVRKPPAGKPPATSPPTKAPEVAVKPPTPADGPAMTPKVKPPAPASKPGSSPGVDVTIPKLNLRGIGRMAGGSALMFLAGLILGQFTERAIQRLIEKQLKDLEPRIDEMVKNAVASSAPAGWPQHASGLPYHVYITLDASRDGMYDGELLDYYWGMPVLSVDSVLVLTPRIAKAFGKDRDGAWDNPYFERIGIGTVIEHNYFTTKIPLESLIAK